MLRLLPRISALVVLAILSAGSALAREPPSDAQVRENIIKESVARYLATGHPCACPLQSRSQRIELRRPERLQPARRRGAALLPEGRQ
jgi:hypothetical protein